MNQETHFIIVIRILELRCKVFADSLMFVAKALNLTQVWNNLTQWRSTPSRLTMLVMTSTHYCYSKLLITRDKGLQNLAQVNYILKHLIREPRPKPPFGARDDWKLWEQVNINFYIATSCVICITLFLCFFDLESI